MSLDEINYEKGFLMDEAWMGGISRNPAKPAEFIAFIMNHHDGEYVAYHECQTLEIALKFLNEVNRDWKFEGSSSCGGCQSGKCNTGACHKLNSSYDHDHHEPAVPHNPSID